MLEGVHMCASMCGGQKSTAGVVNHDTGHLAFSRLSLTLT